MPTYQYSCTECGHFFEAVQSFSDDSLTVCPQCEGRLRKVFNAVGVVFKGSGFYRTDSRAQANGSESGSSSEKSGPEKSGPEKSGSEKSPQKSSERSGVSGGSSPSTGGGSSAPAAASTTGS